MYLGLIRNGSMMFSLIGVFLPLYSSGTPVHERNGRELQFDIIPRERKECVSIVHKHVDPRDMERVTEWPENPVDFLSSHHHACRLRTGIFRHNVSDTAMHKALRSRIIWPGTENNIRSVRKRLAWQTLIGFPSHDNGVTGSDVAETTKLLRNVPWQCPIPSDHQLLLTIRGASNDHLDQRIPPSTGPYPQTTLVCDSDGQATW